MHPSMPTEPNLKLVDDLKPTKHVYDVIIIGAGLSGTSAGYHLVKNYNKLSILVLEAKGRAGGRTQTIELKTSKQKASKFDCGGQWVTDTQTHVTKLLKELNIETYRQFDKGTNVLESNGKLITYKGQIPRISILGLIDLSLIISKINRNANTLDTLDPCLSDTAAKLDSYNSKQFLYDSSFTQSAKSIMDAAIRTVYGLEANQLNALHALSYVKSGGSIEALTLTEPNCAQEKRVKGGTQQISEKLLEILLKNNSKHLPCQAFFNRPIVEIKQGKNLVEVTALNTQNNEIEVYYAMKVISSIPLNQYQHVKFTPDLPFYKKNVFNSCKIGNYIKVIVTYKNAFWKQNGYSGAVVCDGSIIYHKNKNDELNFPTIGPLAVIYDATTDDDEAALVGFIAANAAVQWADQDALMRKTEVIQALVRYFGDEAASYIDYFEKNWNMEPYNGGCPTYNVTASGIMQDYARATRQPFGHIHFCGTESATVWQGYMDGAIESGYRAASEVLCQISYNSSNWNNRNLGSINFEDFSKTYYFQHLQIKQKKIENIKKKKISKEYKIFFQFLAIAFILIAIFYYYFY